MLSASLTINAVEYIAYTRIGTINPHASLRDRAGTLSGLELVIPYTGATPAVAIPRAGQEVILTVDGTREFAGVVQRVSESVYGSTSYTYSVDCADYVRWFDRHLVQGVKYPPGDAEGLTDTAGAIIRAMISDYANQGAITWDVSLVEDGPEIPQQTFDFDPPSSAIDRIAKIINYRWEINVQRQIVFTPVSGAASVAPIATVDWETQTQISDMQLSEVADQIANVAYIKDTKSVAIDDNGDPLSFTEEVGEADGYQSFWPLGYEPANYDGTTVTVTPTVGAPVTYTVANGGLLKENIDGKPGDGSTVNKAFLCLPNWGVRLPAVPAAGSRIKVEYPYLDISPKVTSVRDAASITEVRTREGATNSDGIYEEVYGASDLINVSQDAIRARAQLYLSQRGHKFTGTMTVFGTGWKPGQYFRFTSTKRFGGLFSAGQTFYTVDVSKRFATPDEWVNQITISTDVYGEL